MSKLKKLRQRIDRFLTGKTKSGQVLYGIVDSLPVPNLLNIYRASVNEMPNATDGERLKDIFLNRMDLLRFAISVTVSYLIITGKVSLEDIEKYNEVLREVLRLIGM